MNSLSELDLTGLPKAPVLVGVEHTAIEVDGAVVHCAIAGEGRPVVLLHGWPQHWWAWREIIQPLVDRGNRVICPDVRGLGWSDTGDDELTLARLATDLICVLDVLEIEQAHLVGHDWGAAIGYSACLRWPERFAAFMPIGGLTPWSSAGAPARLWLRPWHILALGAVGRRLTRPVASNSLRAWRHVGAFTTAETACYLDRIATPKGACATERYYRNVALREIPRFVRHHPTMHLRVPTLHLNGAQDPLTRGVPDSYRRYSRDMRLRLLPECGHFIAEEAPELLLEQINAFFA